MGMGKPVRRLEIVRRSGELVRVMAQSKAFMEEHGYLYEITKVEHSKVNGEPLYHIRSIASGTTFGAYETNLEQGDDADS